jgi:thiamine biosynthesis lipoprotein ApbE
LIDPVRGTSAQSGVAAVVARSKDAYWAEGIAKAIVVAGAGSGLTLARDTDVDAWLFLDDGRILRSHEEDDES